MDAPIRLDPIGRIRSPYASVLDAPRQGAFSDRPARIEIDAAYADGLVGVESGMKLLVLWWAHEAQRDVLRKIHTNGVFTMRAPHRPNPICLSEVEVERVEGTTLHVRRLEAIDGTPVLDIKAAYPEFAGWTPLPGLDLGPIE